MHYITLNNGQIIIAHAVTDSNGMVDEGKLVALNDRGKLSPTLLPHHEAMSIYADDTLSPRDLVYVEYINEQLQIVKAGVDVMRPVHGFVMDEVSYGITEMYAQGIIPGFEHLTVGGSYYLGVDGAITESPIFEHEMLQYVGYAVSESELQFVKSEPILISPGEVR